MKNFCLFLISLVNSKKVISLDSVSLPPVKFLKYLVQLSIIIIFSIVLYVVYYVVIFLYEGYLTIWNLTIIYIIFQKSSLLFSFTFKLLYT